MNRRTEIRPAGRRAVVIGIGNSFRRDDGIGPATVATIESLHLPGVSVVVTDGEATRLLDAFAGADLAVVVDAMRGEPPEPGRIHCGHGAPTTGGGNTHGVGVAAAIGLAEALGRAPQRVVLLGAEVENTDIGVGLSDPVLAAIPELRRLILVELGG